MVIQPALFDHWPSKRYRQRRPRYNDQVWVTAVHEAGHAVMAHALKIPFSLVTIRPSLGRVLGHVAGDFTEYIYDCDPTLIRERIAAFASVLVAGPLAQERLTFTPIRRTGPASSDYNTLRRLLRADVPDAEKDAAIVGLENVVGEFLTSSAVSVKVLQLAIALKARITLTQEEAVLAMAGDVT